MKSKTQHIDPLLDNWKTNWETSYLSATTDTPNKLRVAGETPQTNRLFNVTPGLEYELSYTQSENNSVSFSIEESDNGTTWQNIVSNASSNGTQTVSFIPSASFLKVSFEASAGFKLQDVSLNGELFDTLVVAKMLGGTGYRYGFNSMERDNEIKGKGNSYDFGARMYDSRLGRWLSIDPMFSKQPGWSSYKAFYDNPIIFVDPDGRTEYQINVIIDQKTGEAVINVTTAKKIMTDGKKHVVSGWNPFGGPTATWSYENHYYDYATVTTTVIGADGQVTTSSYQEILYGNGSKDADYVWFGGDKYGDTKRETWLTGEDHGQEVLFGIGMSGDGDGPIVQDWSKNIIGSIDFGDLNTILKRSPSAKGYKPGSSSWQKMTKSDAKDWLKFIKGNLKQGEGIGEIIEKISGGKAKEKKYVCPTCNNYFPAADTSKHNEDLGRERGPFKED